MKKQRADIGFGDELENLDPKEFQTPSGQGSSTAPLVPKEEVQTVAEQTGFTSREATPVQNQVTATQRKRRTYRTGRNEQFNMKVRANVKKTFLDITDQKQWVLGETLEYALAALQEKLEREEGAQTTAH